jgi:competence ComEA-like helix-hairpin-helix protein
MSLLTKLESRIGLTRGDVTVTLFVALAALAGFIYLTFFDSRPPDVAHQEMLALTVRHDSIVAARKQARLNAIANVAAPADSSHSNDSAAVWQPLTAEDAAADDAIEKAEKPAPRRGGKDAPARPVNLNAAPKGELTKLPGVGEKTAEAIIERRTHIPFRRIEDIMEVKGIGEKKFEKMKPYLTVR